MRPVVILNAGKLAPRFHAHHKALMWQATRACATFERILKELRRGGCGDEKAVEKARGKMDKQAGKVPSNGSDG